MTTGVPDASAVRARLPLRKRVLFGAVLVLLLALVAEGACRIAGLGAPEVAPPSSGDWTNVELDAPDGRRSAYRESVYVGAPVRINARGHRDWLYHDDERQGRLRVAGVGDSFTFGDGLTQEQTWLRRLEDRLNARPAPAPRVRTLNFGVRGDNTAKEAEVLVRNVLPTHPDVVVLGFTVFNDAEPGGAAATSARAAQRREGTSLWRALRWMHDRSWALNWVSDVLRRPKKVADMTDHVVRQYDDAAPGWIECRAALVRIAAACREAKVPLVVLLFPAHQRDVALNVWSRYPLRAQHAKIRAALADFPETRFVDMADHLAPLEGRRIWIEGNGHPDAAYAEAVADALLPEVAAALGERRR